MKHVAVIGGGFAGLSSAAYLADAGLRVTLVEQHPRLGGRAWSFRDPATGSEVDNGQHLFMRCYGQTRNFLDLIGTSDRLRFQPGLRLDFHDARRGRGVLRVPGWLPSPLNLLVGFARYRFVGWADLLGLRHLSHVAHLPPESDISARSWLAQCRQSSQMCKAFWHPLCISALNRSPEHARADHLAAVVRQAFLGRGDGAEIGWSGVGLSSLYTGAAHRFVERRGGALRTRTRATGLSATGEGRVVVGLRGGQHLEADACVCAVPPPALAKLVDDTWSTRLRRALAKPVASPIVSVNLWLDRTVLPGPLVGLLGARVHWAFSRNALLESGSKYPGEHVALVTSAAVELAGMSRHDLESMALSELRRAFPAARDARVLRQLVVRERHATYSLPPGSRPLPPQPPCPGVYLAGDWTDTGLPATIEGAVLSGRRAADRVLSHLKR